MGDGRRWRQIALIYLVLQLAGCATETPPPVSQPPLRGNAAAAQTALRLQGQPYRYGGESPAEGFDCSGLVQYVYRLHGIRLPRTTRELAQRLPVIPPEYRQPGDLLFFTLDDKPLSHVAIYVGDNRFVHAPSSETGRVMLSSLNQSYWQQHFAAVRRPVNRYAADHLPANLMC